MVKTKLEEKTVGKKQKKGTEEPVDLSQNGNYKKGLVKTFGPKDAGLIERISENYTKNQEEFQASIEYLSELKGDIAVYLRKTDKIFRGIDRVRNSLADEDLTLAEKIQNGLGNLPIVGGVFKKYENMSIGGQLTEMLGNFESCGSRLQREVSTNEERFNGIEDNLDDLLGVQEKSLNDMDTSEILYKTASKELKEIQKKYKKALKKNGKEASKMYPSVLEMERKVEEIEDKLSDSTLRYNVAENMAKTNVALRTNIKQMIRDGKKTYTTIYAITKGINPMFKHIVGAAQMAELQELSNDLFDTMKSAVNIALPAVAELSRTASNVRNESMEKGQLIEDTTIQKLRAIGLQQKKDNDERNRITYEEVKQKLSKRDEDNDVIDAEFKEEENSETESNHNSQKA